MRIIDACREGRLPEEACDARRESAANAVTTEELAHLTSDLGSHEGANLVRVMAAACVLVCTIAAWEPVLLSGRAWLLLALPVTLIAACVSWQIPQVLA
jgi:hypothetical protein